MLRGKSLTREILFMAVTGPILLSSLFAPNAVQILKPLIKWHKNWDKIDRRRIQEAIKRLNKKRLVSLIEKGDKIYLEVTEKGDTLLKNFDYDELKLPNPKSWDKKWRLVIFDIPDKKKKERNAFSEKLKDLGFYPLQESVFIYPHGCQDEIDFISNFLFIENYINYFVIESVAKREGDLRNLFNLKVS